MPKAVFETARDISRKAVWELHVYLIPSLGHIIAGLSRLSAPRRAFSEEENILVIRADSHRIHSVTE